MIDHLIRLRNEAVHRHDEVVGEAAANEYAVIDLRLVAMLKDVKLRCRRSVKPTRRKTATSTKSPCALRRRPRNVVAGVH